MKENRVSRLSILVGILLLILLVYVDVLYNTQVNQHDEYLAQSIHSIAQEEPIEASRGVITDRKGRVLVSNRSVYNLIFDTSLLGADDDQNEAILRLLELCQSQGESWVDSLPISSAAPYAYTLDGLTDDQKMSFLRYLRSLDDANEALITYILRHPWLAETDAATEEDGEAPETDAASETEELSREEQGAALLDQLPASAITGEFLTDAGLSPTRVLDLMRADYEIPSGFSAAQARQVLGIRYDLDHRSSYSDYVLAEDVDTAFISMIADGDYAGARITSSSVRDYATTYASHILGIVGALDPADLENPFYDDYPLNATVGKSGVEAAFEEYLRGTNGTRIVSTNEEGRITGQYYETEPEPGNTVELTIDLELQQVVEDALAAAVESMNEDDGETDRGAAAVVQLIDSGELLALASYPNYDLSTYRQDIASLTADPARPLINRAISTPYVPGSTIKPLTAVAALEEGLITPTERIYSPPVWTYPGYAQSAIRCAGGNHGRINVTQAITRSCNYFFAEMGYELGMDTFREYLQAFGLGESTGLEIGGNSGILPENSPGEDRAPWAGFGQANQAYTPVQLANYVSTLVSGGVRRTPHLLKAVKTYDNSEVVAVGDSDPVDTLDLQSSTLEAVLEGMYGYTQPGGSVYSAFRNCVVSAGAKTGTSQLGGDQTDNGVFICFAPYEDPEIAVAIVIEHATWGSNLASTAVEILNAYFTAGSEDAVITGENQLLR